MRALELAIVLAGVALLYAALSGHLTLHYIVSGSMEPSVPVGSLVIAAPDVFVAPGEMVLYDLEGRTVMHRVSEVGPDGVVITADAYPGYSELIGWERVKGRALLVIPLLGYLALSVTTLPAVILGLAAIIALPRGRFTDSSLFLPAAFSLALMAAVGDTGLASLGRPFAALILLAMILSLKFLEPRVDGVARRLVAASYILLIVACLASISKKSFMEVFGL
ncbi:MAG: hypothetical protein RMJ28_07245 [Nitrososphaerota archaeon]|nr:hypothetical protein [Candidatus Calditenuaceae archaeon]MDW8074009.1 hypothetical protein [Nitrososphaerota archaeon]